MRVVVNIPDHEWAQLVNEAEANGLRVPDLIRAGIESVRPHRRPIGADVLDLVRAGFADAVIGERLGVPNATVSRIRRQAGLPANHFRGRSGGTNRRKTA